MEESISESGMRFVGLDLGDRWSHVYVTDEQGEVVEEGRVRTTPEAVRERFEGPRRQRGQAASGGGGGAQARRAAPPAVGDGGGV